MSQSVRSRLLKTSVAAALWRQGVLQILALWRRKVAATSRPDVFQEPARNEPEAGFTLLEVLVAIGILTVGLMSAVLLTIETLGTTRQSKYMSMAAVLASEKLEDLNRWDSDDPEICVPTGSTSTGSLTSDTAPSILCPGGVSSTTVNYYDSVFLGETNDTSICPGSANSCFTETVSSISNGSTVYTTTSHAP